MKRKFTALLSALALTSALAGCSDKTESSPASAEQPAAAVSTSEAVSESVSSVPEASSEPTSSAPAPDLGKKTIFTGLDGQPVYEAEVTKVLDSDKTAAELTESDYFVTAVCEGFQYFREPTGKTLDSYNNADIVDGFNFSEELPENTNPWKRYNVGDTICGLKLTKAESYFVIYDQYENENDPARFYATDFSSKENFLAEFEGTVEIKGFLTAAARSAYEPDGGRLYFVPTEDALPIIPNRDNTSEHFVTCVFDSTDYFALTESGEFRFDPENIRDVTFDTQGFGIGDIAFAQVTLRNIKYWSNENAQAELVGFDIIETLAHVADTTENGGTMGI